MGAIHIPPLNKFVETIARQCGVKTFIETGTYRGDAARWAAAIYPQVITVEARPDYYNAVREKSRSFSNIDFLLGDSGQVLEQLAPTLVEPCLFWIDAHAGGGNFGNEDVCPLMAEIAAINLSSPAHYILIDDARAFIAAVPPPFSAPVWPSLDQIIPALLQRHPYHIVLLNDAIIAVPQAAKELLVKFCMETRPQI